MDTKTAKLEALSLLALETLTDGQAGILVQLTLKQIGWQVRVVGSHRYHEIVTPAGEAQRPAWKHEAEAWHILRQRYDFVNSVDACLTLFRALPCNWSINFVPGYADKPEIIAGDDDATVELAKSWTIQAIALAMLKTWWRLLPD